MRSSSQRRPPIYNIRLHTEPDLTGARLNALAQAALVYTVIVYMECVTICIPVDKR